MEHVAIMSKSWGMMQKILNGSKKIESRWYSAKFRPWGAIRAGDMIYFKNTGEPVRLRAEANRIVQLSDLTPVKVARILARYGEDSGIERQSIPDFMEKFKNKRYCILIYLKNPVLTQPFEIDKTGFGAMAAWITVDSVGSIRRRHRKD